MLFVADTHVHLYPSYDLTRAFDSAFKNLGRLAAAGSGRGDGVCFGICLTERRGASLFRQFRKGTLRLSGGVYSIESCSEGNAVLVRNRAGERLFVYAGRQIVSQERLEVLALAADLDIPDGGDVREIVRQVSAGGGVPVLPWAPGKWYGRRGAIVREVIDSSVPGRLLVGDTSLRPIGYLEPLLSRYARRKGFKVVAGTDPFPFDGQELLIGRYGISVEGDFDCKRPVAELKRLLAAPDVVVRLAGCREWPLEVLRRLRRLE